MEIVDVKYNFIQLRAKGWSYDKIAKELGKAKQTLIDWSKELEHEIANLKATELEALYESYYLLKENRIKTVGGLLNKITEEAMSRDLSDVPTDKLFDLLLKYNDKMKEEIVDPIYKTSEEITEDRIDKKLLNELTAINNNKILKVG